MGSYMLAFEAAESFQLILKLRDGSIYLDVRVLQEAIVDGLDQQLDVIAPLSPLQILRNSKEQLEFDPSIGLVGNELCERVLGELPPIRDYFWVGELQPQSLRVGLGPLRPPLLGRVLLGVARGVGYAVFNEFLHVIIEYYRLVADYQLIKGGSVWQSSYSARDEVGDQHTHSMLSSASRCYLAANSEPLPSS